MKGNASSVYLTIKQTVRIPKHEELFYFFFSSLKIIECKITNQKKKKKREIKTSIICREFKKKIYKIWLLLFVADYLSVPREIYEYTLRRTYQFVMEITEFVPDMHQLFIEKIKQKAFRRQESVFRLSIETRSSDSLPFGVFTWILCASLSKYCP